MIVGAGIEGESILVMDIGTPAWRIELLEHGHPVAPYPQPYRGRQAAESAADDDGVGRSRTGR
jgi:hypothetical protein